MKKIIIAALACMACIPAYAQQSQADDAVTIIKKSQLAFYYPANDMKSLVNMMLIDKSGGKRSRVMSMLRLNEKDGGRQKYFIYFHEPDDVRGMTFMVWKDPVKEDERWIYIPAVDLIRRIAADDKRSSFVGSDFTYEDVSGRDVESDTHTLLREEKLGDRNCHVVQSIPKDNVEYTKRISWIDKGTFLPIKEEYYDAQGELFRIFTADRIENIQGIPTVMQRRMRNVKTGHTTAVTFTSVQYNTGLNDRDFSERSMRRPPRAWLK